jgi:hypothetical protein
VPAFLSSPSERLRRKIFCKINFLFNRDRCYDFINIFAEKISEKIGVLTQNKAKL